MSKKRRPEPPTITATRVDAVTTEYTDGIDTKVRFAMSSEQTQEQRDATVARMHTWSAQHNDAQAWTFDGLIRPAERYWREQSERANAEPLSKAWYRADILRKIDWVRRIVREGLSPSMSVENAIVWAIDLGVRVEDARWRFSRGDEVRKAQKARAVLRRAIASAAKQKSDASRRANAEFHRAVADQRREHPTDSPTVLAKRLLPKYGRRSGDRKKDHDALRKRVEDSIKKHP